MHCIAICLIISHYNIYYCFYLKWRNFSTYICSLYNSYHNYYNKCITFFFVLINSRVKHKRKKVNKYNIYNSVKQYIPYNIQYNRICCLLYHVWYNTKKILIPYDIIQLSYLYIIYTFICSVMVLYI